MKKHSTNTGKRAVTMMSYFSSEKRPSAIPNKIIQIQEEISQIELHRTEHMVGYGIVKHPDGSCKYCQPYLVKQDAPAAVVASQPKVILQQSNSNPSSARKSSGTISDLERIVDSAGKKGQIVVPRSWIGKRVKVTLL